MSWLESPKWAHIKFLCNKWSSHGCHIHYQGKDSPCFLNNRTCLSLPPHNIIQIHNNVLWDLNYIHGMFLTLRLNDEIFCKILSVSHNIVINMNNVMPPTIRVCGCYLVFFVQALKLPPIIFTQPNSQTYDEAIAKIGLKNRAAYYSVSVIGSACFEFVN